MAVALSEDPFSPSPITPSQRCYVYMTLHRCLLVRRKPKTAADTHSGNLEEEKRGAAEV